VVAVYRHYSWAVSRPLGTFLNQVIGFIPRLLGAAIFLGVAWLLATIVNGDDTRAARFEGG